MPLHKVKNKRSPYYTPAVGDAAFVVGAETSNVINVAVQLKDGNGVTPTARSRVAAYLAADSHGDTLSTSAEGVAAGSRGLLIPKGDAASTELILKGTLVIDANPVKFKTTSIAVYRINGVVYSKAATTAQVFTAAHVISASKFGVILIQVDSAGTISSKVPLATQAYTSAPLALAALPSPDAGCVALGYIAIATGVGAFTANTTDMTNASGVTTASFNDTPQATTVARIFDLVTNATGGVDVAITDTRAPRTYYLVVILPDGTLKVSTAATFA